MAGYRRHVLSEIRGAIEEYLPNFHRCDFDLDAHRKRDALFIAAGSPKTYGLFVEFSSKRPGDFTGELVVMTAPRSQDVPFGWYANFNPERDGIYRVGPFVCGQDRWWQLRDHEEEDFQFFRSLDPNFPDAARMPPMPHYWRPRDFSVSIEERAREAARDFLAAVRDFVIPKLPLKNG